MSTRPAPVWWHCWDCRSNIRSFTMPNLCPICGGWNVREHTLTPPVKGQGSMFERGEVEGDLVHPDDTEGRLREEVAGLLRLLDQLEPRPGPPRAVSARHHWLPFARFVG